MCWVRTLCSGGQEWVKEATDDVCGELPQAEPRQWLGEGEMEHGRTKGK